MVPMPSQGNKVKAKKPHKFKVKKEATVPIRASKRRQTHDHSDVSSIRGAKRRSFVSMVFTSSSDDSYVMEGARDENNDDPSLNKSLASSINLSFNPEDKCDISYYIPDNDQSGHIEGDKPTEYPISGLNIVDVETGEQIDFAAKYLSCKSITDKYFQLCLSLKIFSQRCSSISTNQAWQFSAALE